jgi:hypothetical protein
MWNIFLIAAVFITGSVGFAEEICVQNFNTYGAMYAPNINDRTQGLLQYLKQSDCTDVLQFQEVWNDSHEKQLSKGVLKAFASLKRVRADEIRKDGDKTGLLEFFDGKILESGSEKFKKNRAGLFDLIRKLLGVEKGFVFSLVEIKGNPILMINVHLHHQSQEVRIEQLLQLGRWLMVERFKPYPVILTGDLNAEPGSKEWKMVTELFDFKDASALAQEPCTYCASSNPLAMADKDAWIDYVFVRDSVQPNSEGKTVTINVKSLEVAPKEFENQFLSDHFGLRATVSIEAEIEGPDAILKPLHRARELKLKLLAELESQLYRRKNSRKTFAAFQKEYKKFLSAQTGTH